MEKLTIILLIIGVIILLLRSKKKKSIDRKNTILNSTNTNKGHHKFNKHSIVGIQETDVEYEASGQENRMIDNSKGNGLVRRKLTVSKEWKKVIDISETSSISNNIAGGVSSYFIQLKGEIENSIEEKYSISKSETSLFSEEIEIEVMPHSKVNLKIEWKKIWKIGFISLKNEENEIMKIQYKISGGLTFDQVQEKLN